MAKSGAKWSNHDPLVSLTSREAFFVEKLQDIYRHVASDARSVSKVLNRHRALSSLLGHSLDNVGNFLQAPREVKAVITEWYQSSALSQFQ